jgi:hypothetical protein
MEVSRKLYPRGKSPWYPVDRRMGGPQSRSGHGGDEEKSCHCPRPPPGSETQEKYAIPEAFTAVKIQVEVFWLVTACTVAVRYQRF